MQVKEIQSKKLFKEYLIEVPHNEIDEKTDLKIKELAPKTNLPGFRKGKAPLNLVKKKYENDILQEVINAVIQEKLKNLLDEKSIKPLRMPKIAVTKYEKNKILEFNIKIDLPPEFDLYDFTKLELNDYEVKLTKKDIDENYDKFVKSQIHYHSINENREVKKNDQIIISIKSEDEEVPEILRKENKIPVNIGSEHQYIPELDKILLEKKVKKGDQLKIDLKIPTDKEKKNNKLFKFDVSIIDIKEIHKTKIDEDYLKKNNMKSIDDLKKQIENNLKEQFQLISSEISKKQLLDSLENNHEFEIPEGILNDENQSIWQRVEQAKKDGSLDPDDKQLKEKDLKDRYEKIAKRRVKLALIISHIAKKNEISVNQDEISKGLMDYSKNYPGQEKQIFEYFKNNPSEIEVIRGPIFEKKVIEFVFDKTKKIKKSINVEKLMKIQKDLFNNNL